MTYRYVTDGCWQVQMKSVFWDRCNMILYSKSKYITKYTEHTNYWKIWDTFLAQVPFWQEKLLASEKVLLERLLFVDSYQDPSTSFESKFANLSCTLYSSVAFLMLAFIRRSIISDLITDGNLKLDLLDFLHFSSFLKNTRVIIRFLFQYHRQFDYIKGNITRLFSTTFFESNNKAVLNISATSLSSDTILLFPINITTLHEKNFFSSYKTLWKVKKISNFL